MNIPKEIEDYLIEKDIKYVKENDNIFHLTESDNVSLEYIESILYKKSVPQFGIKGTDSDYFYQRSISAEERGSFIYYIKDFEWLDKHKKDIMKSQILHFTGKTPYRFYARNTCVKVFDNTEVRKFEIENCFYGYRSSSLNLGLVLKKSEKGFPAGTLLMLMTFGKNFFAKKSNYLEVFRAGTLKKCQVIGGASKLFKHFIDNYPTITISGKEIFYDYVVYYVDYDHGRGNSVTSMDGYKWVRNSSGGFMNVDVDTGKVYHRKPMHHGDVMRSIKEGKTYSVPNAGVKVYQYDVDLKKRENLILQRENNKPINIFFGR